MQPASIVNGPGFNLATGFPGAGPFFGQEVWPHVYTSLGRYGLASQAYLKADEAIHHSPSNAERMRVDSGPSKPASDRPHC